MKEFPTTSLSSSSQRYFFQNVHLPNLAKILGRTIASSHIFTKTQHHSKMLYQQLRIIAFTCLTVAHLCTAAHWDCTSDPGYHLECRVSLNPGNDFWVEDGKGASCTHDGHYCAAAGWQGGDWQFSVTNDGVSCQDSCTPTISCDWNNECYGKCSKDAC